MHVAAIHTAAEICFLTAAASAAELDRRVAEYVRAQVDDRLWPDDAREVHALLDAGRLRDATTLYFSAGTRWDRQMLVTSVVESE